MLPAMIQDKDRPAFSLWRLLASTLLLACAMAASAGEVSIARLDLSADPGAAAVLAGDYDTAFQADANAGDALRVVRRQATWWKVTFTAGMAAADAPRLVIEWPQRKSVELWRPGASGPIKRAAYGPDTDFSHTARVLVFPLDGPVRPGDTVYLRVRAPNLAASTVSLQTQRSLQREEIRHTQIRSVQLTIMCLIALMALGLWGSLRQRGYGHLALALLLQVAAMVTDGGEVRGSAWMAAVAMDPRTNIVLNTAAVLASVRFLIFFLGLRRTQPGAARVLDLCSALLGGLLAVSLFAVWRTSALLGNVLLLAIIATILVAGARAAWRRQREAYFLMLAWAPMMAVLVLRVGSLHRWWPGHDWLEYGYPSALAAGGLGLLLGMADKLRQLRRDHDAAHHRATYDPLTGLMTRAAFEDALAAAVAAAHRERTPLALVFFDIDHFKRINDRHGHGAGDQVLRAVGLRTRNRARGGDLCGRYGGDEIAVALVQTNGQGAMHFAEGLRAAMSDSLVPVGGQDLAIGISIGVAELAPSEDGPALIQRADAALYASKAAGRGRITGHSALPPGPAGSMA